MGEKTRKKPSAVAGELRSLLDSNRSEEIVHQFFADHVRLQDSLDRSNAESETTSGTFHRVLQQESTSLNTFKELL